MEMQNQRYFVILHVQNLATTLPTVQLNPATVQSEIQLCNVNGLMCCSLELLASSRDMAWTSLRLQLLLTQVTSLEASDFISSSLRSHKLALCFLHMEVMLDAVRL